MRGRVILKGDILKYLPSLTAEVAPYLVINTWAVYNAGHGILS